MYSMKKWRVWYYYNYNTVKWKDLYAENAEKAIKKSRIKNIISLKEITEGKEN